MQKELIECSKEFANKIKMLSVEIEKKDGKIRSLTQLNERLEQEKKEMENKKNEQQQTIFTKDQKIKEQEDLIKSFHENKDINETVKKENENLQAQNTELENEVSKLKEESDAKIKQLESQLEEKQAEFTQAEEKILNLEKKLESAQQQLEQKNTDLTNQLKDSISKLHAAEIKKKELEDEVNELKEKAKGKDAEVENLKQRLEKEKDELKDSSSKLNATETEKKELEGEVKELKEKLQILEKNSVEIEKQKADLEKKLEFSQGENKKLQEQVEHLSAEQEKAKSVAVLSITDSTKTLNENLTLKNQQIESSIAEGRQQKLKNEQKDAGKKSEGMNKKTKAQAKTKEVDTVSTVSTAKSTASKFLKRSKNLFVNESLDKFLSDQNAKLKEGFPEFKGKHFCHNVLGETIKSLVYQNGYKFKSDQLLALLEENLVQSGKAIIETKVNEVVEELAKDFVKKHDLKQVEFVQKCAEKLYLNKKDGKAIIHSFMTFLTHKNNSNNDSVKKFVVQELTEAEMKCFSDKVQVLALSVLDKT